jgi:hypothetical protein
LEKPHNNKLYRPSSEKIYIENTKTLPYKEKRAAFFYIKNRGDGFSHWAILNGKVLANLAICTNINESNAIKEDKYHT